MQADDLAFDSRHIWHPYTSMTHPLPTYPVVSAAGCELTLSDGRRLVDGMSSWCAAIHSYNHPVINQAINDQISRMSHVMFGGITHPPAVALCRRLVALTAGGSRVHLSGRFRLGGRGSGDKNGAAILAGARRTAQRIASV